MNEYELAMVLRFAYLSDWIVSTTKERNQSWPDDARYDEVRDANPWWTVRLTRYGWEQTTVVIRIKRRKRVWELEWTDTPYRGILTEDDLTKDETYVHAYTWGKLITYLSQLRDHLDHLRYLHLKAQRDAGVDI
jgi:hypothetical protein